MGIDTFKLHYKQRPQILITISNPNYLKLDTSKKGFSYSQAIWLRRICSQINELNIHCIKITKQFIARRIYTKPNRRTDKQSNHSEKRGY